MIEWQTLVGVINIHGYLLFGRKQTGVGKGRLTWPGGKLDGHASLHDCAEAEVRHKTGLNVDFLQRYGVIETIHADAPHLRRQVHIFLTRDHDGNLRASQELTDLRWIDYEDFPWEQMWPSDRLWMPLVLLRHQEVWMRFICAHDGALLNHSYISPFPLRR